jgi:hypothetical protein
VGLHTRRIGRGWRVLASRGVGVDQGRRKPAAAGRTAPSHATRRGKHRRGQHGAVSSRTEDAVESKRAYRGLHRGPGQLWLRRDSSAATGLCACLGNAAAASGRA